MQVFVPAELYKEEIQACIFLIQQGGAIENPKSVVEELPRAIVIAVKRDGTDVVGVGAIKRKRPSYASGIAKSSGFLFDANTHELGYVAVKKSHRKRGISHEIAAKLLSTFQTKPLFATTSHDAMKLTLKNAGFVQRGNEWPGVKRVLSLWIKTQVSERSSS